MNPLPLLALALVGCYSGDPGEVCVLYEDFDGDGFGGAISCDAERLTGQGGDCDDSTGAVHPGADETWYDGRDSDCSGGSDFDADGDGFDAEEFGGDDCDDDDPTVNPDASEVAGDGIDNDCDHQAPGGRLEDSSLSDASATFSGSQSGQFAGIALAGGADLTGDGVLDLIIGSIYDGAAGEGSGAVDIWSGKTRGSYDVSTGDAHIEGLEQLLALGYGVAVSPDADGDGYADLAVSDHDIYNGTVGYRYVFRGPLAGALDTDDADAAFRGEDPGDAHAPRALGNVIEGDQPDWLFPAGGHDAYGGSSGVAYIVSGETSGHRYLADSDARIFGSQPDLWYPHAATSLRDSDGDGHAEVVGAAFQWMVDGDMLGAVSVFNGPLSGDYMDFDADYFIVGIEHQAGFGLMVGSADDQDGDGYEDLAVYAYVEGSIDDYAGIVYLFHGPITAGTAADADTRLIGTSEDRVGIDYAGTLGDFDGDGGPDLLLSSRSIPGACVYYGPVADGTSYVEDSSTCYTGSSSSLPGRSASPAGDVNEDGYDDMLIGDPWKGNDYQGAAYLVLGGGM